MHAAQRFVRNKDGRDFVIGDINGHYRAFEELMLSVDFDPEKDRVFCTGNLLGEDCTPEDIIKLIEFPSLHPVLGGYDYHVIDTFNRHVTELGKLVLAYPWAAKLSLFDLNNVYKRLCALPVIIEVVTTGSIVGVVHGDCSAREWKEFVAEIREDESYLTRIRNRTTYRTMMGRERFVAKNYKDIKGVEEVFVGRTPVKRPIHFGNVTYLDTSGGGALTMIQLNTGDYSTIRLSFEPYA